MEEGSLMIPAGGHLSYSLRRDQQVRGGITPITPRGRISLWEATPDNLAFC
jgi:hypothetical protein